VIWFYLFGKDGNVLVERLGWADVSTGHARLAWRARRQFAFFKNERQQREKRMPIMNSKIKNKKMRINIHKYRSSLQDNILCMLNDPSSISKTQNQPLLFFPLSKRQTTFLISRRSLSTVFWILWSQFDGGFLLSFFLRVMMDDRLTLISSASIRNWARARARQERRKKSRPLWLITT
jgi:hypothetical protein